MKKSELFIRVILFCFILSFISYIVFENSEYRLYIGAGCFVVPLYLCIIVNLFIKKKNSIENKKVTKVSVCIKNIIEINDKVYFTKLYKKKHRVPNKDIYKYLDEDIDCFRSDIESSIHNLSVYDDYIKSINSIYDINSIYSEENKKIDEIVSSINGIGYSNKKFRKIERRVINKLIFKKEKFITCLYKYDFDSLVNIYNEWFNNGDFLYKLINRKRYNEIYNNVGSNKYILEKEGSFNLKIN